MSGAKHPDDAEVLSVYSRFLQLARDSGVEFVFPEDVNGFEGMGRPATGPIQTAAQRAVYYLWPARENIRVREHRERIADAALAAGKQPPEPYDGRRRERALALLNDATISIRKARMELAERADLARSELARAGIDLAPEQLRDTVGSGVCARIEYELVALQNSLMETHVPPPGPTRRDWEKAVSDACIALNDAGFPVAKIAYAVSGRNDDSAQDAVRSRVRRRRVARRP